MHNYNHMSYFNIKVKSDHDPFVLARLTNARRSKNYFIPELSPSERRMIVQRPSMIRHPCKQEDTMQSIKNIIERSLANAKSNRKTMHNLAAIQLKEEAKETIKIDVNKMNGNKLKYSALTKLENTKTTKIRKIRPKSPVDYEKSLIVFKYNAKKNNLDELCQKIMKRKRLSCDSDEDKMDHLLETYFEY